MSSIFCLHKSNRSDKFYSYCKINFDILIGQISLPMATIKKAVAKKVTSKKTATKKAVAKKSVAAKK